MTAAPTETRQHNAPDGHEVSQVELERRQYRVHQQIQSTITSLISTIVFVVVIVIGLKLSPGWPRVKETFFSGEYFVKSFPHVLDGLWLNIRVLLVAVVGVAILSRLIALVDGKVINSSVAKEVFQVMFEEDVDPEQYVEEKGLKTVNDEGALRKVVEEVIAANPQSVEDYHNGKEKAIGFLVGQTMKAMKGKADPASVNQMLKELL